MAVSIGDPLAGRPGVVPMSWEEYERLPEDVRGEYVSGCLVVNPRPAFRHQEMIFNLTAALRAACPDGHVAVSEWAWKPGADEWAPDVMVCPRDDEAVRFTGTPEVIVEVLSTNRADDLVLKLARYAAAGLPRYWIADPLEPSLRAYRLVDGLYREEEARAVGDEEATFHFGVGSVTLRPSDLLR